MSITQKAIKLKNEPDLHAPRMLSGAEIAYRFRLALSGESIIKAFTPRPFVEPQMPPESDSRSEHDVLAHPEPKKCMGRTIHSKTDACRAAFYEMHSSGKLLELKPKDRRGAIRNLAQNKYPEFGPYIITNVHDSLGKPDLKELADLYFPRRNKSVKSTPSSGEKRQHLLDPNSPQRDEIALDRYIREQEDEMKKDRKNPIKGGRKQDL